MKKMLKVALPKGRLGEKAYKMFAEAGYDCPSILENNRKLIFENEEAGVSFFWVKPSDVAIIKQCEAKSAEMTPAQLTEWVVSEVEKSPYLKVIYFQAVDALSLQQVQEWSESPRIQGCIAVQAGDIRLIDNVKIK